MRVLYPLRYYPTLTETFVHREVAAVAGRGIAVHIAALGQREDPVGSDALPSVPVVTVPRRPLRLAPAGPGARWLAHHQRPKDVQRYRWLLRRAQDWDHVHVHFAGEAAEWAHALHKDVGLPYTVMVHAVDLFKPRPSLPEVLGAARAVLTVARHHQPLLPVASTLVRCGPDLDRLRPSPPPPGPFRAVAVGRGVPKKGFEVLLEAWEPPEPGARLLLVSDLPGPLPPGVERVQGLQPSAVFEAISAAHVLVAPSRRAPDGDLDGVPMVLMEALALGRPVITTPVSGIPELVDDKIGWLVPPDDPQALKNALRQAAADPDERALRGAAGPARLRERGFTLRDQVDGVLASWGLDVAGQSPMLPPPQS